MLEVLHSTGLRRHELRDRGLSSIDHERGTLIVRQGKGKKDRVVPIGERAAAWVEKYVHEARPKLVVPPDSGVLFLTDAGLPFILNTLSDIVRRYVDRAEVGRRGSCHLFRQTFATVLLENGADIRHIQEMLGHAQLSTTQMYAHVSIRRLKVVHEAAHPAAKLKARPAEGMKAAKDAPPVEDEV